MKSLIMVGLFIFSTSILHSQNIGINLTNPNGKLHIKTNSTTSFPQLRLTESENDFARIKMENITFPNAFWDIAAKADDDPGSARLNFYFKSPGFSGDRMTIMGNGNVGIGSTSPNTKLEINGKIRLSDDMGPNVPGQIRWNETDKSFQGYDGDHWVELGKSQIRTIGMSEFVSGVTGDQILRDYNIPAGAYIDDGGTFKFYNSVFIPLTFDIDVTVDSVKIITYDNDVSRNLIIRIARMFESDSGAGFGGSIKTSGSSSTHKTLTFPSSIYFREKMETFLVVDPITSMGGPSDWGPGNLRIRSVTVYYH